MDKLHVMQWALMQMTHPSPALNCVCTGLPHVQHLEQRDRLAGLDHDVLQLAKQHGPDLRRWVVAWLQSTGHDWVGAFGC